MNNQLQASPVRTAIEIAVNLLLIFIILAWCLQILRPFISFIVWGAVIAIAMYKPFLKLQSAVGGRKKLAVALFAILGLAVVLVPAWMFAGSILDTTTEVKTVLESGDVNIQPPNESVKEWPVIGEKLHAQWSAAAVNFGDWIEANSEFIKTVTNKLFSKVAEIGLGVLQFVLSTLIAAAFLANAETIGEGMNRLFRRLVGDRAEGMLMLTTSTVQSVTVGVLGIAFIQAFLGGLGMVVAGVPAEEHCPVAGGPVGLSKTRHGLWLDDELPHDLDHRAAWVNKSTYSFRSPCAIRSFSGRDSREFIASVPHPRANWSTAHSQ